jgi:hypothetical protein
MLRRRNATDVGICGALVMFLIHSLIAGHALFAPMPGGVIGVIIAVVLKGGNGSVQNEYKRSNYVKGEKQLTSRGVTHGL